MEALGMLLLIVAAGIVLIVLPIAGFIKISRIDRLAQELDRKHDRLSLLLDVLREELKQLRGPAPGAAPEKPAAPALAQRTPAPDPTAPEPAPQPPPRAQPEEQTPAAKPPPLPPAPSRAAARAAARARLEHRISEESGTPPTPEPATPTLADQVAESAREILRKIWNWILFGEEERPTNVSMEYIVASTWLPRLGIGVILAGILFFLKWSIEQGLINNATRVALSMGAGIGMLVAGRRMLSGKYHLLGVGLMGGGLAALYFAVFAATAFYELLPMPAGFGLALLVTAAAGVLAVRIDALLLAVLGIIGGYCAPIVLNTGHANFPGLYTYLLLLTLGVAGIARHRQWRLLNYLSFLFTYGLVIASLLAHYAKEHFAVVLPFVTAFFAVHAALVYLHNIARANRTSMLEIAHLLGNALVYTTIGYVLVADAHGRPYPALLALGLCAFYLGHVLVFIYKNLVDRKLLLALLGLAGFYAAWTLPLLFERETLTIAWALQAFMFLWLARKLDSGFLRQIAYAVYAIVFVRLLGWELRHHFQISPSRPDTALVYWRAMGGRLCTFGTCIASILGACFLDRREAPRDEHVAIAPENNLEAGLARDAARNILYWFGVLFLFVVLHLELNTMLMLAEPLRLPLLTVLWLGMAAYFLSLYLGSGEPKPVLFVAMNLFLLGALLKLFSVDLQYWKFSPRWICAVPYSARTAGMRMLDFGFVIAACFAIWLLFLRRPHARRHAAAFGWAGLALLFIYASLELNTYLDWRLPAFRAAGISILWSVFAVGFTAGGIWKDLPGLRYTGLALFGVVAGKVFLVDLKHLLMVYRVIAFLIVGVVLLLGAFSYMYASGKFLKSNGEREP